MKISKERLEKEAANTGFRSEILEKVIHLIELLNDFTTDSFLHDKIALKGGTALNLFVYDCPRLSVDIDINYIGSENRDIMLKEKEQIILSIEIYAWIKNTFLNANPANTLVANGHGVTKVICKATLMSK